jgi:hypothetical protein
MGYNRYRYLINSLLFLIERKYHMIRSRFLALSLVSLCSMQMAQANLVKDAGRVVAGVTVGGTLGAAGAATVNALLNLGAAFVTQKPVVDLDPVMIRLFGLMGATAGFTTGFGSTTYVRELRAQLNLWSANSKLIAITLVDYENDTQLVNALERYYLASTYPLVAAKRDLANTLNCLNSAAGLIEAVLEDISVNSSRAKALNGWLDDIYMKRAYVARAATAVENDPRLLTLLNEQNKIDLAAAQQSLAHAHWANAAATAAASRR